MKRPNTPKAKPFPLDWFLLTFVLAAQKPMRFIKYLLGRYILIEER